jgi:hypothetical protein
VDELEEHHSDLSDHSDLSNKSEDEHLSEEQKREEQNKCDVKDGVKVYADNYQNRKMGRVGLPKP